MKVLGIIAEYNPFHNGHEYAIRALKEKTASDYVVVVMSGDYTQRGCPAIFDKMLRTKMALSCGADLVLELPVYYSTGSAEYFAGGAVSVLNGLGCVDFLGFGSETDNLLGMSKAAELLANEPLELSDKIKEYVKSGMSYAAARARALSEITGLDTDSFSAPNDILGTEYIKALILQGSSIKPVSIKREGAGYHDTDAEGTLSSAESIRKLLEGSDILENDNGQSVLSVISQNVPEDVFSIIKNHLTNNEKAIMTVDDLSCFLHYKLLLHKNSGYTAFADVSSDLSDKIAANLKDYKQISAFIIKLKSKDIAYTRISRALLHILLDIKAENLSEYAGDKTEFTSYARILGLNKNASPLLKKIQECSRIPVISRLSDSVKVLDDMQLRLLNETLLASNIYDLALGKTEFSEFSKSVITLQ
ncbi:nucleotidyltransferase [Butyrivibrio sp. WCD3002]|uniref:nucleotidyltransferase n=1 Tax=Butyrivibrio sp. WCD3002 TaxID=1280676 RepID=UPI000402078C|nr:nucleotidyltransferase [Butyrivibrio sp. WCD3002]